MFRVGDRVLYKNKVGNLGLENQKGVVVFSAAEEILVEFDNCIGGHNGNGVRGINHFKNYHCWWISFTNGLKLLEPKKIRVYGIVKFMENSGGGKRV